MWRSSKKDLLFFGANRSTPDNFFGLEAK